MTVCPHDPVTVGMSTPRAPPGAKGLRRNSERLEHELRKRPKERRFQPIEVQFEVRSAEMPAKYLEPLPTHPQSQAARTSGQQSGHSGALGESIEPTPARIGLVGAGSARLQ